MEMMRNDDRQNDPELKYQQVSTIYTGKFSMIVTAKKWSPGPATVVAKWNSRLESVFKEIIAYKKLQGVESIPIVYDFLSALSPQRRYAIVQELCMCDLACLLNSPVTLSLPEQKNIALQFLKGLNAIHGRELVHGDIKPNNILISFDGKVKICDFESMSGFNDEMSPRAICTVGYTPPEMIIGTPGLRIHNSIDLWAAGMVMFNLFAGRSMFRYIDQKNEALLLTEMFGCPTGTYFESLRGYRSYHSWAKTYPQTQAFFPGFLKFWMRFYTKHEQKLITDLLQLEPTARSTASQMISDSQSFAVEPLPCADLTSAVSRYMHAANITRPPPFDGEPLNWDSYNPELFEDGLYFM